MGNCIHGRPATWADDEEWEEEEEEMMMGEMREKEIKMEPSKEVKIKITKKQLEELLHKADMQGLPLQQALMLLMSVGDAGVTENDRHWRPVLQSIPEDLVRLHSHKSGNACKFFPLCLGVSGSGGLVKKGDDFGAWGKCMLNFSAVESLMSTAAVDCWASFAPFLANVICCPQLQATLVILIGQSSKDSGMLALDSMHANYCLSDVQQILQSQGANANLQHICSILPSNFSEASCPVSDVNGFESVVDSSKLLAACQKVDPSIVLRWLSSRLDPSSAKQMLRRISNCEVNAVCPLVFPDAKSVARECKNRIKNHTACCNAMDNYIVHLQKQSFITNLQALDCAASFGLQLQKMNISTNIYNFCHVTLKDFSVQESGCLLPSLPSDATFDPVSGISFTCDLNDNIAAPWPNASQVTSSSCNKTVKVPALPAATSAQPGKDTIRMKLTLLVDLLLIFALVT
ncbi:hypothetical protein J5N97_011385 [Dioscorea zingiberensis]|uniref:SPARK domain-containing protein n=1 Tax=Dioscorea zingiberensis TaxID=325984 RepID=A0A9D5HNA8_9LILI|nr:hypothetical protein J5N97_011385 [Dioscorea zingiberensis]